MAQQAVVSPHFCASQPICLAIDAKTPVFSKEKYVFKDVNSDNVVFKAMGSPFSLHDKTVILDAADRPIVTVRRHELVKLRSRWRVFKGDSLEEKDLICSTKESLGFHTKVHVFLANNMSKKTPNYTLKGEGSSENSCVVYADDSSTIVAQVENESKAEKKFGKCKRILTVYPNVDYALIVALIVTFEEDNEQAAKSSAIGGAVGGAVEGVASAIIG